MRNIETLIATRGGEAMKRVLNIAWNTVLVAAAAVSVSFFGAVLGAGAKAIGQAAVRYLH